MRRLLLTLLPAVLSAASGLEIVRPIVSQIEGGVSTTPGFEHVPGEVLFYSCRISGFAKNEELKMRVAWTVQAFDPKGVALTEPVNGALSEQVLPQDKDWMPKIETTVQIPPLVLPGEYKIVVKAEDLVAKTAAEAVSPFRVRGREVQPSEKLAIRGFRFFRGENDAQPVAPPVFRAGGELWARFDITGYKYGEKNRIDLSYEISVLSVSGRVLWKQPEPALEQSESFYPKPYVPASMSLSLQTVKPAQYSMQIQVKDNIGGQTFEIKQPFTVE